jgi:biotin carboxylase
MSVSSSYVVEKFLEGPLYSVETLTWAAGVHHVWGIADRTVIDGATETSSSFPVYPVDHENIISHVCAALTAIGYDLGAAHTEVILTSGGPRIVEINARVGGSGHLQMLELAMQAPLSLDIVNCHSGREIQSPRLPKQGACWHALVPENSGRVVSMPTRIEMMAARNMKDVWYFRSVNDEYLSSRSNFDWLLEILTSGATSGEARTEAESNIQLASEKIVIGARGAKDVHC